jgi:predicted AAA+ superfamily ATPase
MYSRLLKIAPDAKHSILLLGSRGTGKTQWVNAHFPGAIYLDLLSSATYNELLAKPHRLEQKIPEHYKGWIIIDEIQKIAPLLNEVHRLIESKKYRFILTGSSARTLRRKGVNLLAGRAYTYHMHPLTAYELGDEYSLIKSLEYGQLPMAYTGDSPKQYLASYVQTYLQEEVKQEGLTRNVAAFARFLEVASFSQGGLLNMSEIARESAVHQKMVIEYFEILEDLLIAYRLPVFTRRAKRRLTAHPKFYYFDVGVYRTLRPTGPLDIPAELDGARLETLFLQELRAINDYLQLGYSLYYWRTQHGEEVDFVLYGEKGFHAFEIKRKASIHSTDIKSLLAFGKDYPEAKLHLIYGGKEKQYLQNIIIIPFEEAVKSLIELLQ